MATLKELCVEVIDRTNDHPELLLKEKRIPKDLYPHRPTIWLVIHPGGSGGLFLKIQHSTDYHLELIEKRHCCTKIPEGRPDTMKMKEFIRSFKLKTRELVHKYVYALLRGQLQGHCRYFVKIALTSGESPAKPFSPFNHDDIITEHVLMNANDYEPDSADEEWDEPDYDQITSYDPSLLELFFELQLGMTVKETRIVEEEFKIPIVDQ